VFRRQVISTSMRNPKATPCLKRTISNLQGREINPASPLVFSWGYYLVCIRQTSNDIGESK